MAGPPDRVGACVWLYELNHALGPLIGAYWRLELKGQVDAIPDQGPLIVTPNHASFLDPWFTGMVFPRPIRYLITADWYHRSPLWRALFRSFGTQPVARSGDAEDTFAAVLDLLSRGEVVGVFPEGKISHDGRMQRFRTGAAILAARSGAPVLPLGIRGNFAALPRSRKLPRPSKVSIHVGESLVFPDAPLDGIPDRAALRLFNSRLRETVSELVAPP